MSEEDFFWWLFNQELDEGEDEDEEDCRNSICD